VSTSAHRMLPGDNCVGLTSNLKLQGLSVIWQLWGAVVMPTCLVSVTVVRSDGD
jgi:hypothetical protein